MKAISSPWVHQRSSITVLISSLSFIHHLTEKTILVRENILDGGPNFSSNMLGSKETMEASNSRTKVAAVREYVDGFLKEIDESDLGPEEVGATSDTDTMHYFGPVPEGC
ncbi:MAG: hypothetical protein R3D26_20625 [Cyanobacteriota/Melainabacteria group bacterium]